MKFLLTSLFLVLISSSVLSEEARQTSEDSNILSPNDEPFYNVSFGASSFDAMLGIELQKGNHSVGLGLPFRLSYRYYCDPYGDSLFYGLYAGRHEQPDQYEKKLDGVIYENAETVDAGFGTGYRWQWPSSWNVTASFSIHFMSEEYSNPGQPKKKDSSVIFFPGINVGYKF